MRHGRPAMTSKGYAKRHPLRKIRRVVNHARQLRCRNRSALHRFRHPSIPPERLIRARLLQILLSLRFKRQLMEQVLSSLMFRWFVGRGIDDPGRVPRM